MANPVSHQILRSDSHTLAKRRTLLINTRPLALQQLQLPKLQQGVNTFKARACFYILKNHLLSSSTPSGWYGARPEKHMEVGKTRECPHRKMAGTVQ